MKDRLTAEQSNRLIELGVDASKASATIVTEDYNEATDNFQHPIYTLSDLLSLLPKRIKVGEKTYFLKMEWIISSWAAGYITLLSNKVLYDTAEPATDLIDCLYELLIFCIKEKICEAMNEQEISKLAREYAEENPPSVEDEVLKQNGINLNAKMVFEPFLKWLTEQYCIVKKSEVEKQIKDIEDDFAFYGTPKSGNFDAVMYQRARGRKQILLRVFGTDLFKERSEK